MPCWYYWCQWIGPPLVQIMLSELIYHPAERRMAPVLDLDPAIEPAAAVRAVAMFRDQPLQPHQAGVPEQVRPNLALLERRQVNPVDTPRQE